MGRYNIIALCQSGSQTVTRQPYVWSSRQPFMQQKFVGVIYPTPIRLVLHFECTLKLTQQGDESAMFVC